MQIPSGTVTFLFTDIEGSTRQAREHPDQWENVRIRHHEILRGAIEQNNGYVFQVIGDGFCAAFHRPQDALKAAVQAQQRLENEAWGETTLRVRMGIHTGEAESDGQDYYGYLTLSLVQRLMASGHGGQVLVSGAAENLLRGLLPGEMHLLDLGRHYFKDVPQPMRLFQVLAPGLQRDFPPVRTIDLHPNNLPSELTSFVGREKERAEIRRLLHHTHMLTLIGPGGTGKTRLSIHAAREMLDAYSDGVWLVELAPVLDPLLVPRTTTIAVGLRDEPQRPVTDMLCDYLRDKKMLLLLDNCEHLVDACARMADRILRAAPDVSILASSREALGIGGEVTYRVPSLGLPDLTRLPPVETLNQYAAVRLFIDRATSADPTFTVTNANAPAVAQICHRLDGIPLAIELAAAKISVLEVDQIAKRLDDRFKLLTGGSRTSLERHQTLRSAIDWSYNLLPSHEELLFQRLSVFVGGWTLEAAETVCSGGAVGNEDVLDLLEHLIHKSLVFREESRYRMLETIRQYANEKLVASGDSDSLRDRHLHYFLDLAETAEPHLIRPEQLQWLAQLDADQENLRAAIEWTLNEGKAEYALRLCAALGHFWDIRNHWMEGSRALAKALAMPIQEDNLREKSARVRALYNDAMLANQLDELDRLEHSAVQGLALAEQGTNELDIAIARTYVGESISRRGRYREARVYLEKSLQDFARQKEMYWEAYTFNLVKHILTALGELKMSEAFTEALELATKSGERMVRASATMQMAYWHYLHEQIDVCEYYLEQANHLYQQLGQENPPNNSLAAGVAVLRGDTQKAKSILLEFVKRLEFIGEKNTRASHLLLLGKLAMDTGELDQAHRYLEQAMMINQEIGKIENLPVLLVFRSRLENILGNRERFKQILNECVSALEGEGDFRKFQVLTAIIAFTYFQNQENSLKIFGTLDYHYKQWENSVDPILKRDYDMAVAKARSIFRDDAFEVAHAEGAKLSLDAALDLVVRSVEKL